MKTDFVMDERLSEKISYLLNKPVKKLVMPTKKSTFSLSTDNINFDYSSNSSFLSFKDKNYTIGFGNPSSFIFDYSNKKSQLKITEKEANIDIKISPNFSVCFGSLPSIKYQTKMFYPTFDLSHTNIDTINLQIIKHPDGLTQIMSVHIHPYEYLGSQAALTIKPNGHSIFVSITLKMKNNIYRISGLESTICNFNTIKQSSLLKFNVLKLNKYTPKFSTIIWVNYHRIVFQNGFDFSLKNIGRIKYKSTQDSIGNKYWKIAITHGNCSAQFLAKYFNPNIFLSEIWLQTRHFKLGFGTDCSLHFKLSL